MSSTDRTGPEASVPCHPFRYNTTGLRGKRLRLLADVHLHASAAPDLAKATDVIAVDDTPNVNISVRVHPLDDPHHVVAVAFDQLALYDDP
jgi:hypothetical protein